MKANIKTEISSFHIFYIPANSNELIITFIYFWLKDKYLKIYIQENYIYLHVHLCKRLY